MTGIIEAIGMWADVAINFSNNFIGLVASLMNAADNIGGMGISALAILSIVLVFNWFTNLLKKPKGK